MQFAGQEHKAMTTPVHNSAPGSLGASMRHSGSVPNDTKSLRTQWPIWTPQTFVPKISDVASFEASLSEAIEAKRDVDAARLDPKLLSATAPPGLRLGANCCHTMVLTGPTKFGPTNDLKPPSVPLGRHDSWPLGHAWHRHPRTTLICPLGERIDRMNHGSL